MKKFIKIVCLIAWLSIIYFLSSQDGSTSGELSSGLLKTIASILKINNIEIFVDKFGSLIREIAHFCEYLILSVIVYMNLDETKLKNKLLFSFLFCFVYAISDEIHQIFVADRVFDVFDIMIDSFGALLGIFFTHLIYKRVAKRKGISLRN